MKQRLRLANASPVLLQAYEDDEITLDQLMAFCLMDDHERQEQVWDTIQKHWNKGAGCHPPHADRDNGPSR